MVEGINMGRRCPWTKDELLGFYNKLSTYAKALAVRLLQSEGQQSSMEAYGAYNMFKFPVVYVFIHYHYGKFEDLGMSSSDISTYLTMYMTMTKEFTSGILEGLQTSNVFYYDSKGELSPMLEKVCKEVIYILNH